MARIKLKDLVDSAPPVEPFEVELSDGSIVIFPDPKSLPLASLLELGSAEPKDQVRILLGDAGEALLADPQVTASVFDSMMGEYLAHVRSRANVGIGA